MGNKQQRVSHTVLSTTTMAEAVRIATALAAHLDGESLYDFRMEAGGYPGGGLVSMSYVSDGSAEVEAEALSMALAIVGESLGQYSDD